jgi:monoterpene epsilon-lactone hydrolase
VAVKLFHAALGNTPQAMKYSMLALVLTLHSVQVLAESHTNKTEFRQPVPATISEEAKNYYRNVRGRSGQALDLENPKVRAFTREFLAKIFLANVEQLGIDYKLEEAGIDGVESYWVRTSSRHDDLVLIYLHGGGFVLGSAKTNLALPVRIGLSSGIPVLSLEYRLAPEHPFPAALEDALDAYRGLLDRGYTAEQIGVFGDSAGGNLTIALALKAREEGLPLPAALVVLSPSTDRTWDGDTHTTLGQFDPILGPRVDQPDDYSINVGPTHPLVSPVFADLHGLPPLLIQVGTRERLLSDSVRLARRAREAGVDVTLDVWEGMWHVWQDHPTVPEARQASDEIAAFFAMHLN